jgi:hypothetical protein
MYSYGQLGSKLALYSEGRNGKTSIYNLHRGMGNYVKNHCSMKIIN